MLLLRDRADVSLFAVLPIPAGLYVLSIADLARLEKYLTFTSSPPYVPPSSARQWRRCRPGPSSMSCLKTSRPASFFLDCFFPASSLWWSRNILSRLSPTPDADFQRLDSGRQCRAKSAPSLVVNLFEGWYLNWDQVNLIVKLISVRGLQ